MTVIQEKACTVINTFLKEFADNPLNYLYESDIRAVLYTRLYDAFADTKYRVPLHPKKHDDKVPELKRYTNPVKSEYPTDKRFDIAILDSRDNNTTVQNRDNINSVNDNFWRLALSMAIEIKYIQLGEISPRSLEKLNDDLKKIEKYANEMKPRNFYGVGLMFFQYDTCINMQTLEEVDAISIGVAPITGFVIIPKSNENDTTNLRILKVKN